MEGLRMFLVVLLGVVSYSHGWISGPVLEVTVRPGDNITLYCDCKLSSGVYIVWYRNCSHENQPSLVLELKANSHVFTVLPGFQFVRNYSSASYDLLIMNVTDADEGLYYCGTKQIKVEDKEFITPRYDYRYGNVTTRIGIIVNSSLDSSGCISSLVPSVSWVMVFTPALMILSSFLSFILIHHFCQKADKERQILQKRPDAWAQTSWNKDEDVYSTQVVFRAKEE
ncbi:uncharacterized protein LOC127354921 [Dicentrarchus labrax]|uniref:uncharacterized protein LOC127354921 n=1 Tax=Dicentrarchus labrax TaxID=13489 RepID=UPI0021F6313D|nr:uncharacterized protein LOC127354921 [Dicentrarchus labrax]